MLDRRTLLLATGAIVLVGCGGKPKPTVVTLDATSEKGANPGPDGADRPVTVAVFRLKDLGAFNTADFFALQGDPATALGASLVGQAQLAVPPGGSASLPVTFEPEAAFLGLVALLRDPNGKTWRVSSPVKPGATATGKVTLGPTGIALALS